MLLRKQELNGRLERLKGKPPVQPLQGGSKAYAKEIFLNKILSVGSGVTMTHQWCRWSRHHYHGSMISSWELVSKANVTEICCTKKVLAPDFVSGWMKSVRAVLHQLNRTSIPQRGSRASANITPCAVVALAEIELVSSCLILTELGLWVIILVRVGIKEHVGGVVQCTQQNNHNSPLPINKQHTQISLCHPGLVLENMICSLSWMRMRLFGGLMPEAWDCGLGR